MKNWKTKTVSALLALSVLVPSAAFAADAVNSTGEMSGKKGFVHHQFFNKENHQEFNGKLLGLVSKYTPESLEEWENVLAQQDQLMNDLRDKNPVDKQRLHVSAETKEKVKAIREDVKSGKLPPEQAQEQLKSLGIEKFKNNEEFRGKEGFKVILKVSDEAKEKFVKDSPMTQLREAVEANDETKIKELLPQILEQIEEKCQALSNKLIEPNK